MTDISTYTATINEVATHFSISLSTARSWIRKGHIPRDAYLKAGTTYRFSLDLITQALLEDKDKQDAEPEPDPTWQEEIVEDTPEPMAWESDSDPLLDDDV